MKLPCGCQAAYCSQCWDRSLVSSLSACGSARCPSCRCKMHVEYDASCGRPIFSRAKDHEECETTGRERSQSDGWRPLDDLYTQARPRQIELLKQYGTTIRDNDSMVAATSLSVSPSDDASPKTDSPHCACGSRLTCMHIESRTVQVILAQYPQASESLKKRLMRTPLIACDICDQFMEPCNGRLWTCDSGSRTVLHGAGYDICEACFSSYTGIKVPGSSFDVDSRTRSSTSTSSNDFENPFTGEHGLTDEADLLVNEYLILDSDTESFEDDVLRL